jgi:NADH-quinone oxidoreductase subunit L
MVTQLLPATEYHIHSPALYWTMVIGTQLFVGAAIAYAYFKYIKVKEFNPAIESNFFYKVLFNQYYIPKFYDEFFSKPYAELSRIFWKQIDLKVVDATVDLIATAFYKTGEKTHGMQNGNLSTMLRWMVAGTLILLVLAVAFSVGTTLVG